MGHVYVSILAYWHLWQFLTVVPLPWSHVHPLGARLYHLLRRLLLPCKHWPSLLDSHITLHPVSLMNLKAKQRVRLGEAYEH
jgi:hypothetical protein